MSLSTIDPTAKTATKWTPKQRLFLEWLSLPAHLRRPRFQQEFALQIGVSEGTLCTWKRLPGFQKAVYDALREDVCASIPDVLDALKRQAIDYGRIDAIRDLLAIGGFYSASEQAADQRAVNLQVNVLNALSPGEARRLLEQRGS